MLHIFFVPDIFLERYMTFPTHSNRITQSFKYEAGGGAIGAPLAWPLQRKLGTALAFIAMLFVLALPSRRIGQNKGNRRKVSAAINR